MMMMIRSGIRAPFIEQLKHPHEKTIKFWTALNQLNSVPRRELHLFNIQNLSVIFRLPISDRTIIIHDLKCLKELIEKRFDELTRASFNTFVQSFASSLTRQEATTTINKINSNSNSYTTSNTTVVVSSKAELIALCDLGIAYLSIKESQPTESIQHFTHVLNQLNQLGWNRSNVAIICLNNRGTSYNDCFMFDEAIIDFSNIISFNDRYGLAFYNRALGYQRAHRYHEAIADYSKAIDIDPLYEDAYNNKGNCYYELSEFDRAIEEYETILKFNPSSENALFNRALSHKFMLKYVSSFADLLKVIQLQPDDYPSSVEYLTVRGHLLHCCTCDLI